MTRGEPQGAAAKATTAIMKTQTVKMVDFEIVHQIKGRIRFRIPRLERDVNYAQRLVDSVMLLPGVTQARVSSRSASLIINYQPEPNHAYPNGNHATPQPSLTAQVIECIRLAAEADVAHELIPPAKKAIADRNNQGRIDSLKRLRLPLLGLGLSAGALAGLGVPGLLVGGVILASAIPIFQRTVQGIREERRLTVDFLDATTILLLTAQGSFVAPAVIVGIIESAEVIRDWTARRNKQMSLDLLLSQERQVLVERAEVKVRLSRDDIQLGDVILLYPGDQIPVDGVVLAGSALVDQHQITGDALPILRGEGDDVHATTFVVDGHLRIRATRTGHDTQAAVVMALMAATPDLDTRVSNYARKVGNWAVVPTLAAGAAVWATSGSLARATGIVSLDLGTGMRVSSPIAILSSQTHAAQQGILIRSGRALEKLSQINAVVFDKTATLTRGQVSVADIRAVHTGVTLDEVLQLAASAEQSLDHPVAQAIVRYAHELGIQPQPCTTWSYIVGQGVVVEIGGQTVHVGSNTLLENAGIEIAAMSDTEDGGMPEIATRVYIARAGELVGIISCTDPLRSESPAVVAHLREMNITSFMLSGDSQSVALATAASLSIAPQRVYAEVLPQQKMERVQELRERGISIAVVGDGINDAAAMAHADVSIALGSATDLARETADVVLLNNDLRDLVTAIEIAKHSMSIIEQNQTIVVVPNLAAIAYGIMAVLSPGAAVIINNGSAFAAALNSLRGLNGPGAPAKSFQVNDKFQDQVVEA